MLCSSSLMNCLLKSSPMAPRIRLSRSLAQNYCSQQPSTSAADQKQRPTSHKRFYESVNIVKRLSSADPNVAADHDLVIGKRMTLVSNSPQSIYEVHLDGRPLRTPASKTFRTFSEPLALAVAHEWASQESQLHRDLMCLTGLSFTSLDNPFGGSKESVVKDTIGTYFIVVYSYNVFF